MFEIKFYFVWHICIFASRKGKIYHIKEGKVLSRDATT